MSSINDPVDEYLSAVSHGIGAVAAVIGAGVLITMTLLWGNGWQIASAIVFSITLILLYTASTLYHSASHETWRTRFQIFDHCAIYLLIAGTYTPITLVGLRENGGWWLFAAIWAMAAVGVVFKLFFTGRFKVLSTILYIAMGWIAVTAIKPMTDNLSDWALLWIFSGGLAYTLGTAFYLNERMRYAHSIWHGFVLTGSCLHFAAVTTQVL